MVCTVKAQYKQQARSMGSKRTSVQSIRTKVSLFCHGQDSQGADVTGREIGKWGKMSDLLVQRSKVDLGGNVLYDSVTLT